MSNLTIEERLHHYFLAMGAQQTESAKIPQNNLMFVSGSERTCVVILKNEEIWQRNRIVDTLLSLASLRASAQLLYLAVPRLLGASVDAAIFSHHGIGLLLFDERRIDEALAPRSAEPTKFEQEKSQSFGSEVMTELLGLKSMYAQMERNISKLRDELDTFQRAEERHGTLDPTSPPRVITPESAFVGSDPSGASLPPFLVDNPWLDVLSKRGRTGNDPIAG